MATVIQSTRAADRARHETLEQLLSQQGTILRNRRQLLREGLPTEMSGVMDVEERSSDAEAQDVGFSVLELTSRTVQGIETALERMEAGLFGTCSDCRCRISDARLRALPFAALCLACQEKHDIAASAAGSQAPAGWKEHVVSTRPWSIGQLQLALVES